MIHTTLPFNQTRRLSFYLAMEEYVARHLNHDDDCFFMWQVNPSVIFGRNQLIEKEVNALLGVPRFAVAPKFSAPEDPDVFLIVLRRDAEKERRRGVTLYGPHLDDFEMSLDGKPLRICGSTGQIRMISLYLKLAEFSLVKRLSELPVLVLADDVTGELDAVNTGKFFELTKIADQAFFTFAVPPEGDFFSAAQQLELELK